MKKMLLLLLLINSIWASGLDDFKFNLKDALKQDTPYYLVVISTNPSDTLRINFKKQNISLKSDYRISSVYLFGTPIMNMFLFPINRGFKISSYFSNYKYPGSFQIVTNESAKKFVKLLSEKKVSKYNENTVSTIQSLDNAYESTSSYENFDYSMLPRKYKK